MITASQINAGFKIIKPYWKPQPGQPSSQKINVRLRIVKPYLELPKSPPPTVNDVPEEQRQPSTSNPPSILSIVRPYKTYQLEEPLGKAFDSKRGSVADVNGLSNQDVRRYDSNGFEAEQVKSFLARGALATTH